MPYSSSAPSHSSATCWPAPFCRGRAECDKGERSGRKPNTELRQSGQFTTDRCILHGEQNIDPVQASLMCHHPAYGVRHRPAAAALVSPTTGNTSSANKHTTPGSFAYVRSMLTMLGQLDSFCALCQLVCSCTHVMPWWPREWANRDGLHSHDLIKTISRMLAVIGGYTAGLHKLYGNAGDSLARSPLSRNTDVACIPF